ncbi:MAG: FkbM family methyltransferase [Pseudomonadota bacterium]
MRRLGGLARSLAIYYRPASMLRWRRFYKHLLAPGELVFDVGAHVGTRARAMRRAGARVVALEPQALFAQFLKRTMPADIIVLDLAVGRIRSDATLAVSSHHPTVSTLNTEFVSEAKSAAGFDHVKWDGAQRVAVVTLDDLIDRFGPPRYVKIDVEGSEADVLAGLSHPVPLISAEYLPAFPLLAVDLIEQLAAMGNDRFNVVQGESGRFLWPDWRKADVALEWLKSQCEADVSGDIFACRTEDEQP